MHVDWELVKKAAEAHENDTEAAEALLLQALGLIALKMLGPF